MEISCKLLLFNITQVQELEYLNLKWNSRDIKWCRPHLKPKVILLAIATIAAVLNEEYVGLCLYEFDSTCAGNSFN